MTPKQLKSRIDSSMRWVCIRLYILHLNVCSRLLMKTKAQRIRNSNDQKTY
jgi:hypothetical protein